MQGVPHTLWDPRDIRGQGTYLKSATIGLRHGYEVCSGVKSGYSVRGPPRSLKVILNPKPS